MKCLHQLSPLMVQFSQPKPNKQAHKSTEIPTVDTDPKITGMAISAKSHVHALCCNGYNEDTTVTTSEVIENLECSSVATDKSHC